MTRPRPQWVKATAMFLIVFLAPEIHSAIPTLATNHFEKTLRSVPFAELPAAASALVRGALPEARTPPAVAVVRLAVPIDPAPPTLPASEVVRAPPPCA